MTKKLFIKLSMLLFVLGMSTNVAWGNHMTDMTDEQAETYGFWARLTAKPATATNGSGKVFVSEYYHEVTPSDGDYVSSHTVDGWSDVYAQTSLINGDVRFSTYAKADPGSYFTGWSFTDGSTDLGDQMSDFWVEVTPSSKKGHSNIREYIIYAAFNKVQIASYEFVSGSNTTTKVGDDWTCTQTIKFRAETPGANKLSNTGDYFHFKRPVVTKKDGTNGTWSIGDAAWIGMGAGQNFYPTSKGYAELIVPVVFTAPDGNPGEYAAELVLETYAGVKMKVYLYARTTGATGEATRYNSAKVQYDGEDGSGTLSSLLGKAVAGDIIKLNGNYENAVNLNKDITFDLNGFTLNNTLTVSGGNVTIAYSPYGGSANALSVSGGKAILNGGTFGSLTIGESGTVEQNGATITGAATNNGSLTTTNGTFQGGLTSSKTLVVNGGTFTKTEVDYVAIKVTGGSAQIKRGVISGDYGVKTTNGGEATIEKLADFSGCNSHYALQNDGGSIIVNNGKFYDPVNLAEGEITFNAGYFQYNGSGESTVLGKQVWRNTAGPEFRAGYNFFAGSQDAAQASNVSVCRIGQTAYASLEDALAYANNNPGKEALIFMENDYTLKAGYYTVPANATLVVPMSDDQDVANPVVPRSNDDYITPYKFRRLTLENGVNINVLGTIEITCVQNSVGGEEMSYPHGPYGHLMMKPGSHITLSDGSELRAWGYITGDGTKDADGNYLSGEIDARRGSTVREQFQMGDWKGGNYSLGIISDELPHSKAHLFPIYEYFIQNIESPVKYHPGSSLITATSVFVEYANAYANDIKVVGKEGEPAMFLMDEMADAENTWVRKFYDAKKDQQVYEVNSGAQLGSLLIELGSLMGMELSLNSAKFVLPLTSNFKIHLLSGSMQFTQSTSCLPGMEVEVDKESEVSIIKNSSSDVVSGALYFYDSDQWGKYVMNGRYGAIVQYSATWALDPDKGGVVRPNVRSVASAAALGDAKLIVHGTFRCAENCAVYTTAALDYTKTSIDLEAMPPVFHVEPIENTGGACITSTNEDAGTFIFDAPAPTFVTDPILDYEFNLSPNILFHFDNVNGLEAISGLSVLNKATGMNLGGAGTNQQIKTYSFQPCTSARLKNGAGAEHEFAETAGTEAGKSYCYMNNQWTLMDVSSENECFMKDNYGVFYAKPSEYVAVVASVDGSGNVVGNDDHTFSDAAGAGRLFILMEDDCQWWEVEKKDNLYHCIHPNNDTYYYWDEDEKKWMEQRFTITWKNWDGEEIKSYTYDPVTGDPEEVEYSVTYGTQAEYLGSNPTRPADIDYTYNFTGWSPALGKVTSDVTYTATFEAQPRKYTIIFTEEGGAEIERQFLLHNDVPVCENTPTRTGFTLEWEPAIAAVTGDATYHATWLENPPTEYQVTFYDYNGTTKLKPTGEEPYMVAVGTVPTPPADPTGKPETDEYTYVFDHWSPALEAVSATSVKTYTAVYREVAKTYTVRFYQEDGTAQIGEAQSLVYGEMPVAPTPTKQNPQTGYTYTYVWQNKADASKALETVKADANYKAVFTGTPNKYTVTVKSNPSGACSSTGAGLYDYNTSATLTLSVNSGYTFTGWSDGYDNDDNPETTPPTTRTITVTEDKELVANFTVENPDYTITWKSEDGSETLAEVGQKSGTATTFTGATPTKTATAAKTFTFYGWSTQVGTEENEWNYGTIYKNGLTPNATANATYYAYFNETASTYDVVWMNEAGTVNLELDYDQPYGAAIAYNSATPTKTATEQYTYTFDGWSAEVGGDVVELPETVTGDAVFYAHFISTPIVSGYNLVIGVNGKETLAATTTKDNLIITSNGVSSGQLINANNLTLNGEAIFRMEKTFNAGEWYAVAVPWTVNPSTGIYAGSSPLSLGSQIYVIEFDAAAYVGGSTNTYDYWTFLHQTGADMVPGKLYMIYLASGQSQLDFHKKAGADILTTQTAVSTTGGDGVRANWNAIANPALYHANLSTGASLVQKYNGNDSYIVGSTSGMIVGEPMFVQVSSASTVVATPVGGASPAPYRRAPKTEDDTKFVVELTQNGQLADRLIVETEEEKANEYVIGQDLAKFGVSSKVAQMWIDRYDSKLCVNTVAPEGEATNFPLSIFAQTAGEYTISVQSSDVSDQYALYLTLDGNAIWNLSEGAYTLNLNKGTVSNYGLRVSARAPQVVTGVDEAIVDAQGETRKVLINNQVFIIRGDKVYSVDGRLVK